MADMGDPGFIPPVTSFFHDEDAHSTGSSVTTSDVLTKHESWSNHLKAFNYSLSPGCSVTTEKLDESGATLCAENTVFSAVTDNVSVRIVSAVSKDALSVLTEKAPDHIVSNRSDAENGIRLKKSAGGNVESPPDSQPTRLLKTREFSKVDTDGSNNAVKSDTPSLESTLLTEVSENRFNVRPGTTVASIQTDKVSADQMSKSTKSSGSTVISAATEEASVAGTTMSAITEKRSVAGTTTGVMPEKDSDESFGVKSGKIYKASKASALPPMDKRMPLTVKEFAAKGNSNASKSNSPSTLSVPSLPKTTEKQLSIRAETPTTPKISNAKSSISPNLSFSYPLQCEKPSIQASRSVSPSFGKSTTANNVQPSKTIELSCQTKRESVSSSAKIETTSKNSSSLDTIESAIIVTDTLSSTRAIVRGVGKVGKKETPPLHKNKTTAQSTIIHNHSFSHPQTTDKKQIVTSSSFDTTRKESRSKEAYEEIPKTTLFKKTLSFGSNSTKDKSNPGFTDDGIRVFPGFANSSVCSKGSSKSSKNSASDTSTAASTLSKSSSENRSEGNFSSASTECTRKASNMRVKTSIQQSLSFTTPQKETQPIQAARSMSPSLLVRQNFLLSTRTDLKDDVRETVDLPPAKNTSMPPRAPSYQLSKQRHEMITVVLESEKASMEDDSNIEVVSVNEVSSDKETNGITSDSLETKEGAVAANGNKKSCSTDSNLKRRQKILFGTLLRSRQERRKKEHSPTSLSSSDVSDKRDDNKISLLESFNSDNPLKTKRVNKAQNNTSKENITSGTGNQDRSSRNPVASDRVSDVTVSVFAPHFADENKNKNEVETNANIGKSVPVTQIDINPNDFVDDTSLSLDPELSHKHKFQIWHEDTGFVDASSKERFSCVDVGFKLQTDDKSITLSNDGDDFLVDDLSFDGRKERQSSPLAFCDDTLGEELVVEMKSAASQIVAGVKNATWSTARKLFGAFDITANGGVDYLADEVNATQEQLITGTISRNKSARSHSLAKSGVPTAQRALDEAIRQKLVQKKGSHPKESLTRELTIVEMQEQVRMEREKEDLFKKKKHVQQLKTLALKHM
ncbi:hypothetical protein ACHAW6_009428 [Cyclotella cf. meneghiniana]